MLSPDRKEKKELNKQRGQSKPLAIDTSADKFVAKKKWLGEKDKIKNVTKANEEKVKPSEESIKPKTTAVGKNKKMEITSISIHEYVPAGL